MMILREQDKHFLWSLYFAMAIIFLWKGLWEGIYEIPYVGNPWVFLFIGLAILTFTGLIFKEFDPLGGMQKVTNKVLHAVHNHPHKNEFQFKYYDKRQKKDLFIDASRLQKIEKGTLVLHHHSKNQEQFIPIHRITEILYQGKVYWKL